jgi:glycosyltransferase involved in cell wall biosynthesis
MHVVVVHPNTDLYGSDRMLLRAVLALRDASDEVELHVPAEGAFTRELGRLAIPWQQTAFPVLRRTLLNPSGLYQLARQLITSLPAVVRAVRRADVVYVNTVNCGTWLVVAKLLGVPAVCHVRENEPGMGRLQRALLLAPALCATRVLTNSCSTRDWVLGAFGRLRKKTEVLYNGLELPEEPYARPFDVPGRVRLLLVGRLSWRKGQTVALQALAAVRRAGVDATLTLAGEHYPGYEAYVEELHTLVADLDLTDVVRFVGFHHDLSPFWADADVALVPSLLEPFGNVAVEAMAAGVPVIASAVQGLAEIIEDGVTGRLTRAGDVDALTHAILQFVHEPESAIQMATTAAHTVAERYSLDRYQREVVQAITAVPR